MDSTLRFLGLSQYGDMKRLIKVKTIFVMQIEFLNDWNKV